MTEHINTINMHLLVGRPQMSFLIGKPDRFCPPLIRASSLENIFAGHELHGSQARIKGPEDVDEVPETANTLKQLKSEQGRDGFSWQVLLVVF